MKNYYELLEVDRKASKNIINKVYKIHVKENHPDLFNGTEKEEAEKKIKILNEAYEVLSDDLKRKNYDNVLDENDILKKLKDENEYLKSVIIEKEKSSLEVSNFNKSQYTNEDIEKEPYDCRKQASNESKIKGDIKSFIKYLITVILITIIVYLITGINLLEILIKFFKQAKLF